MLEKILCFFFGFLDPCNPLSKTCSGGLRINDSGISDITTINEKHADFCLLLEIIFKTIFEKHNFF